jgi:hypothetical protein
MQDLVLSKDNLEKEIEELRVFLEKCLITNSSNKEFIDFVERIAFLKNENFSTVSEKLRIACESLEDFSQITKQVEIQSKQAVSHLAKSILETEKSRKQKTGSPFANNKNELSFEEKFALEILEGINEQLVEANKAIINVVENAWDYLPVDVHELFQKWGEIYSKIGYPKTLVGKIFEDFKASSERRDNVILNATEKGKSLPKFRISNLTKVISNEQQQQNTQEKLLNNSDDDTIFPTRRYTLEELIEKITPENTHEETNWGNAVGQEIWW